MSSASNECFVALGGNLGDVRRTFAFALDTEFPRYDLRVSRCSSAYRTVAETTGDVQPDYWNAVVSLHTDRTARHVLEALLEIEDRFGRVRTSQWAPRPLDLDLLLFGDAVVREPDLEIPHPRMHTRGFVLVPLSEIAPDVEVGGSRAEDLARTRGDGILERDSRLAR
ncbi:MAG: 2-amino-4-hydroxy-6-hydroxymethyldihydropteridine diphosphokinase [Myxococcota bacterium]